MLGVVHSALLWGLVIVGVPVLIHLINMLRHRRVEWAAIEFLLASQKKNRTWIMFKQLLLLLLRMLAIAAIVLLVAQPLLRSRVGEWFGRTNTHHIVLIDDSFSMSDRWADTSAFDEAKLVIERIGAEAGRQIQPQTFTLLRFSRAARLDRGTQPDLLREPVGDEFASRLGETLGELQVSQTAAGPTEAIDAIGQLLGEAGEERRIVYLVSDFRVRQWDDPTDLQKQLLRLNDANAEIHLISCVDRTRPNLAITSLSPAEGIRAAGVPFFMEVTVHNFGLTEAKQITVVLEEKEAARPSRRTREGAAKGGPGEGSRSRPAVTIAEIPPGRAVRERLLVHFPNAGRHLTTARLKPDSVAVDNARYAAVDLPADIPVLLIDGSPDARDANYLGAALAPGGPVRTGLRPQIETPRYLSLKKPLKAFRAITLMNVQRLDQSAIDALERYLAAGGGVAVFLGEQCRSQLINDQWYRNGEGFFPLPLQGQQDLLVDRVERGPDLQVGGHPIFRVLAGERNSFVSMVIVQRYFAPPDGWAPEPDSTARVIARLRNGAPLAVERRFGDGRVVAFLTTAAPVWNNWARNPSFVVAMQDMQAHLGGRSAADVSRRVGSKLQLELDKRRYRDRVRFVTPGPQPQAEIPTRASLTKKGTLAVSLAKTDLSGVYQAELTRQDGSREVRPFAFNVDAAEGDLKTMSGPQLAKRLQGVDYRYEQADGFQYTMTELAGHNISDWLLYLLVVLLIGEQVLAWSASYHPPRQHGTAPAKGGGP